MEQGETADIISLMCSLQMESLMDTADLTKPWTVEKGVAALVVALRTKDSKTKQRTWTKQTDREQQSLKKVLDL